MTETVRTTPDVMRAEPWDPLPGHKREAVRRVKELGNDLHALIEEVSNMDLEQGEHGPDGRSMALAKTKLQESIMWAVHGITA